jgi:hypothetical protein
LPSTAAAEGGPPTSNPEKQKAACPTPFVVCGFDVGGTACYAGLAVERRLFVFFVYVIRL